MVKEKDIEKHIHKAAAELNSDNIASALKSLQKVLELDAENLEVHYLLGIAYTKSTKYSKAVIHLTKVTRSKFNYLHVQHAHMLLGYAFVQLEKYDDAYKSFERVLSINFNNDKAIAAQAHVLYKMGLMDDAINAVNKALEINPDNYNARNTLAYLLAESGRDIEQAMREAQAVNKAVPDNYVYQDTLGWIYYKKGKEGLARETLQHALDLAPDNEEIKEHLRIVLEIA